MEPKVRLLDRVRNRIRAKHYSYRTEQARGRALGAVITCT